ncbi:hypothetical protein NIES592_08120 [Fischerella major NIES-592]|uniref:Uncharacterized protein n=1 Tax=Fischerella major NIES-592 TaxID=210994 RepID=A0A1U7H1H6_9CYAN|nr:hypothetical protein [Fischerella major]OKH14833.1 hypothetical protein NIES592_08120 [Fischerella major NIES-592]
MPLDPEIQKAIADTVKDQLTSVFSEVVKPLTEQLEKQQHDNKKLSEAFATLSNSIPGLLDERLKDIKPSLDFIAEVRKEYEAEQGNPDTPTTDADKIREAVLAEVKKEYEGKLTGLQSQLDERDKETKALREADRQAKMRNEVLNTIRGLGTVRPSTEEDLLTLLEKRGLLVEESDRLFVKGVDKFGDATKSEFKDILPKMLETDFAHFAVPRGGTGTDGSPGTRATPSQYNFEGMTAQDIYNRYGSDETAQKAMVAELEKQYGKPS